MSRCSASQASFLFNVQHLENMAPDSVEGKPDGYNFFSYSTDD
jgi:hypothetical protein